ncbi:chitinase-3-like protein 2 isoform X2 [Festucalex cinctus]
MHKIILFAGLCLATAWLGSTEKLVCVYDSASYRRWGIARFKIEDIQPNLCTHLIYSFVCTDSKLEIVPTYRDKKKFPLFKKLKNSNPHLKTILEVNLILNPLFSELIAAEEHRATFIKSAISILRNPYYMFDGINLVWLNTKKLLEVKNDFTKLIREFQDAFYAEAVESGYEKLLLTASVSAEPSVISHSYDVKHIAKDIDFFNVMTSDIEIIYLKGRPSFCLPEESFNKAEFRKEFNKEAERRGSDELLLTVSVSAEPTVISQSYDVEEIADHIDFFNVMTSDIEMFVLNVQPSFSTPEESFAKAVSAVNFWNQTGVPSHKINMGIGVFGEAYTNDSQGMIQAEGGLLTDVPKGFLARYELCSFLDGPLEASSDKNVVFDDIASIDAKVQYIKKHHFGGAFVLSLDLDDFQQVCSTSDKKYPVIQHLHDELVEYY